MKKLLAAVAVVMTAGAIFAGCSYAGVAATSDGKVVLPRNDDFLYGLLRAIYVCKVTDDGLTECKSGEQEG